MEKRIKNIIPREKKFNNRKIDTDTFIKKMENCLRSRSYKFERRSRSPSLNSSISKIDTKKNKDKIGRRLLFSKDKEEFFKATQKKFYNSSPSKDKRLNTDQGFYNNCARRKFKTPKYSRTMNKFYKSGKRGKKSLSKFLKFNINTPKIKEYRTALLKKKR